MLHPSPEKLRALKERWNGQEARVQRIAESIIAGEDWTRHLRGLPHVDEIPPREGEAYGRDLRGADLRRMLHPRVEIARAGERDAGIVASVALEGLLNNTPLRGVSPFPPDIESAAAVALAMRRGDHFLVARLGKTLVGTVRWAVRREFPDLCDGQPYGEISNLAVSPAHRRVGIGALLLASAEWDVAREGLEWSLLRTAVEVGLVPFYESRGWCRRTLRQFTYPDGPTVLDAVLSKRLAVIGDVRALRVTPAPAAGFPPT
jgi:GNAT superfamily N-acetyltransferase